MNTLASANLPIELAFETLKGINDFPAVRKGNGPGSKVQHSVKCEAGCPDKGFT
jgi:hypothetical protein